MRNFLRVSTLAVLLAFPLLAHAELVEGAQLPDGSRKVGEHRYRSPLGYEETKKYFRFAYPEATHPRRTIADQPNVRGFHIVTATGKGFEGLNVYEANDEVRIFIVPEQESPKPITKKKVTGSGRKR
jgi:hypothetical protein